MLRQYLLCFVLGCVTALSMPGFDLLACQIIGFSAFLFNFCRLYYGSYKPSVLQAAVLGWSYGFGFFLVGLYWIGNALLVDGNSYVWVYPLAVAGLPFVLSLFWAVAFGFSAYLSDFLKVHTFAFISILMFCVAEASREFLFTGFPWNYFAYAWHDDLTLLQSLSVLNLSVFNTLIVFSSSSAAFLALAIRFRSYSSEFLLLSLATIVLFVSAYVWGQQRLVKADVAISDGVSDLQVVMVQPNIPQDKKWDFNYIENHFTELLRLSKPSLFPSYDPDIPTVIVWPETALHYSFYREHTYLNRISNVLAKYSGEVFLVTGVLVYDLLWENGEKRPLLTNSVSILNKDSVEIGKYDKSHLVPFGEYIPYNKYIPIEPIARFNNIKQGDGLRSYEFSSLRILPLICYEVIFSGEVARSVEAYSPNILINVTNDAWYGDSAGPQQHLVISKFRAIENNIPLVRVANTGISVVVDKFGRHSNVIPFGVGRSDLYKITIN